MTPQPGGTLRLVQIELHVEGTAERLRQFVDELQAVLADDATVNGWLGTADSQDEPKQGTIYVDVFDAEDQPAALERVQPAIRRADPDSSVVKGGTTVMQVLVPPPPDDGNSRRE